MNKDDASPNFPLENARDGNAPDLESIQDRDARNMDKSIRKYRQEFHRHLFEIINNDNITARMDIFI